jgi:hypothetical protein
MPCNRKYLDAGPNNAAQGELFGGGPVQCLGKELFRRRAGHDRDELVQAGPPRGETKLFPEAGRPSLAAHTSPAISLRLPGNISPSNRAGYNRCQRFQSCLHRRLTTERGCAAKENQSEPGPVSESGNMRFQRRTKEMSRSNLQTDRGSAFAATDQGTFRFVRRGSNRDPPGRGLSY